MTGFKNDPQHCFRQAVDDLVRQWRQNGLPARQGLMAAAAELERFRERLNVAGLWRRAPTMVTASLDDGLGQGLDIIHRFAAVIGIQLIPLGLLQTPATVIGACQTYRPDFLGLTILQFDTEADLAMIANGLPPMTRIVAGGPVFTADPGFKQRTGTHYAARHVGDFLDFMLTTTAARS